MTNKTGGVKGAQYCAIMTQSIQVPPFNCFGIVSLSVAWAITENMNLAY